MTILVTGATGFIGRHLVRHLLEQGETVRVLTRNPDRVPAAWDGRVDIVIGDLANRATLRTAVQGVSLVYHLAGELRDDSQYEVVNHLGTRNLLESSVESGVRRFLHLSSVGVIGAKDPGWYDEQSLCSPRNPYEKSKLLGEQAAREHCRDRRLEVTVVRPTIVFGPRSARSRDSFLSWMKAIAGGRFCLIGSGDAFANYVYVEDVVESCVHLTQDDEAVGEVYHIADPATMKGFVGRAAELLGVRMPAGVPEWAAYALAIAAEGIGRVGRFTPPLTVNRVRALTSRVVFGGDKLARSLVLPVGWREGLRRTILAYRQMELLP